MCLVGVKVRLIHGFVILVNSNNDQSYKYVLHYEEGFAAAMEASGGSAGGGGGDEYFSLLYILSLSSHHALAC